MPSYRISYGRTRIINHYVSSAGRQKVRFLPPSFLANKKPPETEGFFKFYNLKSNYEQPEYPQFKQIKQPSP